MKKDAIVRPSQAKVTGLRIADQESARVVVVYNKHGNIVGAGSLVSPNIVLTCGHVVEAASDDTPKIGSTRVLIKPIGIEGSEPVGAKLIKMGNVESPASDLALLQISKPQNWEFPSIEFASPLRHGGKKFSVLGFPDGDAQGRNASGFLQATDALGLVQMDTDSSLFVMGGFSGAPVWSPDVSAFVGIVVSELSDARVAWCIPSRILCRFYGDLSVRFRIPVIDRPQIFDYEIDDPNVQLFGTISNDGKRRLSAVVKRNKRDDAYVVRVKYECLPGSHSPRGRYVTFITYPDFKDEFEDGYEVFSTVNENGIAKTEIYPTGLFTLAAIGDGGDTVLTITLQP